MKISQTGIDLIKSFEGCRLTAYKPVPTERYWTIGYGSYGPHVKPGMAITKAKAEEMLREELERFEKGVNELVKVPINQNQFDALVSFAYNCGLGNLKSSTLLKYVNQKEFSVAADEFGKWTRASGNVLKGLVRRRAAEKELFEKPVKGHAPKKETLKKSDDKYKVVKAVPGYLTAADAKAKRNKKTTVKVGPYHIFNKSAGMINVTSKKGVPGSWINPADNK